MTTTDDEPPRRALTAAELTWWRAAIERLAPLADGDVAPVAPHVRLRRLDAGTLYLQSGAPATTVGLIRSGLVREGFLCPDGRERVRAFGVAGDFAGSLSDLLRGGPSRCQVIACAPTRVITLPWSVIERAVAERPAWRAVLAAATARLYLLKAEREYELLALDAEERYRAFRARLATIEPELPLVHVASYLGITPEHLSRLRRRMGLLPARAGAAPRSPRRSRR